MQKQFHWKYKLALAILLSTITMISILALLLFLDAIRTRMEPRTTSKIIKIRKKKKKRNEENITQERQDKSHETEDKWEIPSDHSSHNSEQFTSDYGSTYEFQTIEEIQQHISPTKQQAENKKKINFKT